jgi:hypothetical protein
MQTVVQAAPVSSKALWAGHVISALVILFLLFDGVIKLLPLDVVTETLGHLGYIPSLARGLGVLTLVCAVLYAIPQTSVLGAILLTGYLGGAIAAQARIGSPLFSTLLFPVYVAALIWGGLWLRDARLRALVPVRSPE